MCRGGEGCYDMAAVTRSGPILSQMGATGDRGTSRTKNDDTAAERGTAPQEPIIVNVKPVKVNQIKRILLERTLKLSF